MTGQPAPRPNLVGSEPAPRLSVLVVNFNSTPLLRRCLDAIASSTVADRLETIVVDNASHDFDADLLNSEYPWVTWLPQSTNTTYTGGNNLAWERSTAELILLLNPDTRVEPDALERAIAHMDSSRDLAGLGAYLIGPDGRLQRYYRRLPLLGDLPTLLFEPLFRHTARGRRFLMLDESFEEPTPVENPPGAFTLLRRSVVVDHLLDPVYFNFVSDLELCERLSRAGRVVVFPDIRVHHQRAGGGVGTRDPAARLRLYHDLTWGLRQYFRSRGVATATTLNALLVAYWAIRLARICIPRLDLTPTGFRHAVAALAGRPPNYSVPAR